MRNNFIVLLSDEERSCTNYDPNDYIDNLPAHKHLQDRGYISKNHYTASAACSPSRASVFTGQYPSVHQVTETYGGAKEYNDPRMVWLQPNSVPTMGHYFRALDYDTVYIGKWHISFEDIVDEKGLPIPSVFLNRKVNEDAVDKYQKQKCLNKFGFDEWIGPDPHGTSQNNSGWLRDPDYVRQFMEWFDYREKQKSNRPFLVVVSLVNPHDIVYFPFLWSWFRYPLRKSETPKNLKPIPTFIENLDTKPTVQKKYKEQYGKIFAPIMPLIQHKYRQLYYYLISTVDHEMYRIIQRLEGSIFKDNTYTVFTSDHGDLLGAHNGMYQKWYSAYEEIVRIPFIISHPKFIKSYFEGATSSVDIIPTMLGLSGVEDAVKIAQSELSITHSELHPLPGTDLSIYMQGTESPDYVLKQRKRSQTYAYIQIEDEISRGANQMATLAKMYPLLKLIYHFEYNHVIGPTSIEAVVYICHGEKWKLVRYWDNPAKWTNPHEYDMCEDVEHWAWRGKPIKRKMTFPDEYELYNITDDPNEKNNLYNQSDSFLDEIRNELQVKLITWTRKRPRANQVITREKNKEYNDKLPIVRNYTDAPLGLFMVGNVIIMGIITMAMYTLQGVFDLMF
jgi:arylsulfatase A-like enzyme